MSGVKISRRSFLKGLVGIAITSGLSVPAFDKTRLPYVAVGDIVNYIGPSPGFIGGKRVIRTMPFDGIGYPVVIAENGFGKKVIEETYYDIDLADFLKEVPADFWHKSENRIYPNIHTWLRMKRYGETIKQAIYKLNFASSQDFISLL
ncbi:hypothetical protein JAO78_005260 [Alishewanella sp. 16-MA]|uniref:Twin-arginine translocation signal domain-containing protein n=1 Tax=Alishewanella maricola TaxID=2795740 RepID=A0ABS8C2I8_9ALTE|nr:hypothetical protein [Alishewanella maricola]MCB5226220.1 hypothetical protein [Alishewanella maricola]